VPVPDAYCPAMRSAYWSPDGKFGRAKGKPLPHGWGTARQAPAATETGPARCSCCGMGFDSSGEPSNDEAVTLPAGSAKRRCVTRRPVTRWLAPANERGPDQ
jgi:hypothetical protein